MIHEHAQTYHASQKYNSKIAFATDKVKQIRGNKAVQSKPAD